MKLPLKVTADLFETVGEMSYYECSVMVPGVENSSTVCLIRSTESGEPVIGHVKQNGLHGLDDGVRDRLLIALFKLVYGEMVANDGSAIQWWFSDISRFVNGQFGAVDVASITFALGSFEFSDADDVSDMNVVRID